MPFEDAYAEMKNRLAAGKDALAKAVSKPEVGRIEFTDGESGRYTWFEIQRIYELTGTVTRRVAHTNHIVRAKFHELPAAHVRKPALAERIIRAIPAPLYPYVRIVTGTEVVSETKVVSERKELNWLGKLRQMAAHDPAIVIGELCLFGWE
jgi:hypothetical protein